MSNILIGDNDELFLTDFGLSELKSLQLDNPTKVGGPLHWLSPERVDRKKLTEADNI
jgi:serine/threonine protein kinase